jgi:hypothetical protein
MCVSCNNRTSVGLTECPLPIQLEKCSLLLVADVLRSVLVHEAVAFMGMEYGDSLVPDSFWTVDWWSALNPESKYPGCSKLAVNYRSFLAAQLHVSHVDTLPPLRP